MKYIETVHYSTAPLVKINGVAQIGKPEQKPRGLWVSVPGPDDWKSWCEAEGFRLNRLASKSRVQIDASKVLHIQSIAALDGFHREYSEQWFPGTTLRSVNWERVAKYFAGIVIAPYQWDRRFTQGVSDWYYSWDCASGCVWDPDCITIGSDAKPHEVAA